MHSCIALKPVSIAICKFYLFILITAYYLAFSSGHLYCQPSWSVSLLQMKACAWVCSVQNLTHICRSGGYLFGVCIVYADPSVHVHEDVCVCLMCVLCICIYIVLVHTWNSLRLVRAHAQPGRAITWGDIICNSMKTNQ